MHHINLRSIAAGRRQDGTGDPALSALGHDRLGDGSEPLRITLPRRPVSSFELIVAGGLATAICVDIVVQGLGTAAGFAVTALAAPLLVVAAVRRSCDSVEVSPRTLRVTSTLWGIGKRSSLKLSRPLSLSLRPGSIGHRLANATNVSPGVAEAAADRECDVEAVSGASRLELAHRHLMGTCALLIRVLEEYYRAAGIETHCNLRGVRVVKSARAFEFAKAGRDARSLLSDSMVYAAICWPFAAGVFFLHAKGLPWPAAVVALPLAGIVFVAGLWGPLHAVVLLATTSAIEITGGVMRVASGVGPFRWRVELPVSDVLVVTAARSGLFVIDEFRTGRTRPLHELVICTTDGATLRIACGQTLEDICAAVKGCTEKCPEGDDPVFPACSASTPPNLAAGSNGR